MKANFILPLLMISTLCYAQTETNQQAYENYQKADQKLNDVYQQILNQYKSDTVFIQNLRTSQRIWVQFRDAELKAKYPEREPGTYGSILSTCKTLYLTELTEERIDKLEMWVEGSEEGDVCAGSVMKK